MIEQGIALVLQNLTNNLMLLQSFLQSTPALAQCPVGVEAALPPLAFANGGNPGPASTTVNTNNSNQQQQQQTAAQEQFAWPTRCEMFTTYMPMFEELFKPHNVPLLTELLDGLRQFFQPIMKSLLFSPMQSILPLQLFYHILQQDIIILEEERPNENGVTQPTATSVLITPFAVSDR
eukprot:UN09863